MKTRIAILCLCMAGLAAHFIPRGGPVLEPGLTFAQITNPGSTTSGTVTSIATTTPITGGTITDTGTIACATCAIGPGSSAANHLAKFSGTDGVTLADGGVIPTGTVTSIATTGPITGGTITATGTIACATCVTSATGGGLTWDQIGSPAANQTLTMTGDSTTWNWGSTNTNKFTFDTTGNPTFGLVSATTAVTNSPVITIQGSYQNAGAPTFAANNWTFTNEVGSGTNGTSDLLVSQSGTTGVRQLRVTSFQSTSPSIAVGSNGTGIGTDGSNNFLMYSGANMNAAVTGSTGLGLTNAGLFGWVASGNANGTKDTGLSRGGAGLVDVGTGAAASTAGFIKTAQTLLITGADVTCGTGGTISSCVAMQTVTGLSVALPLVAANWSFDCTLIVSQATAAAANQIGVQTATNGATNLSASGIAYTAAAVSTAAAITGVASTTTAQSVVTFTPGATGTKLPIKLTGTIEGASASGTTFNVTVLTGAAADLLTIYRGSTCQVY